MVPSTTGRSLKTNQIPCINFSYHRRMRPVTGAYCSVKAPCSLSSLKNSALFDDAAHLDRAHHGQVSEVELDWIAPSILGHADVSAVAHGVVNGHISRAGCGDRAGKGAIKAFQVRLSTADDQRRIT